MNGKLSNIGKWVFGLLALITVGLAIYFYLGLTDESRTNLFLNWGYILIILGIVIALISVIFTAAVKGVNGKTLLIAIIAFAIIAVVAYFMSKGSFNTPYQAGELTSLSTLRTKPENLLTRARRTVGLNLALISSMSLLASPSFQSCSLLSTRQLKSKTFHHGKKNSGNQFKFAG